MRREIHEERSRLLDGETGLVQETSRPVDLMKQRLQDPAETSAGSQPLRIGAAVTGGEGDAIEHRRFQGEKTTAETGRGAVTIIQAITKFRIEDTTDSQGAYLDYEIYLADEYDGENTQWTLVASGMREWDGIYTPPGTVGAVKAYDYPVQKVTTGRYLKFVIVKCESVALENRGKLGDVWCFGLE